MYMKARWQSAACLILCGVLIWFLTKAENIRTAAAAALRLCGSSVIPAMFPFLVVSSLLVALGFGEWLSPRFAGLMGPLFCLPGFSSAALVLGLVGGYPIGARTATSLYTQHMLTKEEAERLLTFCNNSNPVFLISVLGSGVFGSSIIGVWLWLIHILSALLTGLLFRGSGRRSSRQPPANRIPCRAISLSSAFVSAIRDSVNGMLSVCGFVVLFYTAAQPLTSFSKWLSPISVGFLELFSLTPLLAANRFGFIVAAGCTGWGGVSVLAQTAAMLEGSGLSLLPALKGKLVQGLLSTVLAVLVSSNLF